MIHNKRLYEIDWSSYQHAYGNAGDIPKHLTNLFSNDQEKAYAAIVRLEASLCHQHVGVAPALLPAFPFLIEALHELSVSENLGYLLEMFWGVSQVTCPPDRFYSIRVLDLSWTSIPSKLSASTESYVQEIRQQLLINRGVFTSFLNHQDDYVFDCATLIVSNFNETPVETAKELQTVLSYEANPIRRNSLFSGLRHLPFENKLDYLTQAFHEETDIVVKSTIAGQIAYEMKTDSPSDVVALLSAQVLGMSETDIIVEVYSTDFFEDVGIPLALARPEKYEYILQRFINYVKHLKFINHSTNFLGRWCMKI